MIASLPSQLHFTCDLPMKASTAGKHNTAEDAVDWRSLLKAAQAGDSSASETLAIHLGPRLRGFFRRLGAPPQELEDLAIEVLTKVFQNLDKIRNGDLLPWTFQVARNHLRDFYSHRALPSQPADMVEDQVAPTNDRRPASSPLVLAVRAWLRVLSVEDRHLLEARLAGVPHEIVAAELGLACPATRKRFGRLLKRLDVHLRTDPALAAELVRRLG
jgi:RNA polymerase sigma-70 factor (ECF subfamily)